MSGFFDAIRSYLLIYQKTFIRLWEHMTPQQYASLLMFVALVGFIAMRSKPK